MKMRTIKNLVFLAISFCCMAAALANSISTVGGKLFVKEDDYPKQLFLDKSSNPILEDHLVEIQKKLPYSNTVDFVLIQTHGGGNAVPFQYCLLKISSDKTWELIDLPIATWEEASLSKEGEYIKVTSSEEEGYKTYQITITINANGKIVKEDKKLDPRSLLPEIKSFNDLKKDALPPAALIQLPAVKEDLKRKGLYDYLDKQLDGMGYVNLEKTKDGNTVFAYAQGIHAENWVEIAIEVDRAGAYFVLLPAERLSETAKASFEVYSNYGNETIKQLLRAFLENGTLAWFTEDSLKSTRLFINGKKIK